MKQNGNSTMKKAGMIISMVMLISLYAFTVFSLPAAPTLQYQNNSTSTNSGIGILRSGDDGGYITTINLNVLQQNLKWKAYVGNVSGRFVLEDADGYSIYEWDMGLSTQGKVFIARNQTVDWTTISCSNRSNIYNEESSLNILTADSDSINSTFGASVHQQFKVGPNIIVNSTCPSIATYINSTNQTLTESSDFQEVILSDGNGNIVYTTVLEQDQMGYRNDTTYDFQAIVADDETALTITNYYFYVELGI